MQIERLARDPEYARRQYKKGGAFFQSWTEGALPSQDFAPAIAADAIYIYGKRPPLAPDIVQILREIERRAPQGNLLPIIFTLGWMVGKAHERWRLSDPQAKRLLRNSRKGCTLEQLGRAVAVYLDRNPESSPQLMALLKRFDVEALDQLGTPEARANFAAELRELDESERERQRARA